MNEQVLKEIYARAIGDLTLKYLESVKRDEIVPIMESRVLDVIAEIKSVLDDETLNDSECFRRIEAIVTVFQAAGIDTSRHDWRVFERAAFSNAPCSGSGVRRTGKSSWTSRL